jgi:hypothetical protein
LEGITLTVNIDKLKALGFDTPPDKPKPRIIMSIDGKEGTGKTELALSAPGPMGYQSLDIGTEGVIEKHVKAGKEIYLKEYHNPLEGGDLSDPAIMARAQTKAEETMDAFTDDFKTLLESGVKTVVWDTASELWQILRLARFGKLLKVMPLHYGPVNLEYLSLVKQAYLTDTNLILIHKVKAVWEDNEKTNDIERNGMNETGYLVQVDVNTYKDDDGDFHAFITKCRAKDSLTGEDYPDPMNTFPIIASEVYPDTDEDDWSDGIEVERG